MTMYRKTALIEAHQWFKNGDHPNDGCATTHGSDQEMCEGRVVRFFRRPEPEYAGDLVHDACGFTWHQHGWIDDLEGGHVVCPADWIPTGVQGEHWAIKPDIFAATYSDASTDSQDEQRQAWNEGYQHGRLEQAELMVGDFGSTRPWLRNVARSLRANLTARTTSPANPYKAAS